MATARGKNSRQSTAKKNRGATPAVSKAPSATEKGETPQSASAAVPRSAQLGLSFEQPMLQLERQIQELVVDCLLFLPRAVAIVDSCYHSAPHCAIGWILSPRAEVHQ